MQYYDLFKQKYPLLGMAASPTWLQILILAGPLPRANCPIFLKSPPQFQRLPPFSPSSRQYKQYYTYTVDDFTNMPKSSPVGHIRGV